MPTPFYHLSIALDLLDHPGLPSSLRQQIQDQLPAYLLGHTAPDVQVISGQKRVATHFFEIPIPPGAQLPWVQLLLDFPQLQPGGQLANAQRSFLAGYLCHLQADWLWARQIYQPFFGPAATWQDFRQRQYLHNVLRSYLDFQVLQSQNGRTGPTLAQAEPDHWLPFTGDENLVRWRDLLAAQFQPGAHIQTVEMFAARQGIAPEKYYQLLASEAEMNRQIFHFMPRSCLENYRETLLAETLKQLVTYLECTTGG